MSDDLARRAVACKGWRWAPGMRSKSAAGGAVRWLTGVNERGYGLVAHTREYMHGPCKVAGLLPGPDDLPDLADVATLGCLLGLVREAWDWPNAFACHDEIGWYVPNGQTGCSVEWQIEASDGERHDTEAAALVAALEAAP